jgi:hypothetical protein
MSFTAISPSGNRFVTFWKLADAIELLTGQIASELAGHKKDNIPMTRREIDVKRGANEC